MVPRRLLTACLSLATVLLVAAPTALADLGITVDDDQGYDVYVTGAQSLDHPQNLTISLARHGYLLQWDQPANVGGKELVAYVIYRVPGAGQEGDTISVRVGPSRTSIQDPFADSDDTYVYFVTALYGGSSGMESIPSLPVSNKDITLSSNYPHCSVASIYASPPYYDIHLSCLFPAPV